MPGRNYVKSDQWHILARVDDAGWHARCGAKLSDSMETSTKLRVNEATCNTCTELALADEDKEQKPD